MSDAKSGQAMKHCSPKLLTAFLLALTVPACDRSHEQSRGDMQAAPPNATNDGLHMQGTRVYAPVTFYAEARPVSISACLSMDEVSPVAEFGGAGALFDALVRAFKAKTKRRTMML